MRERLTRLGREAGVAILAMACSMIAIIGTASLELRASLFPLVIAAPVLLLSSIELVRVVVRAGGSVGSSGSQGRSEPAENGGSDQYDRRRLLATLGWLGALVVGLWLFGFVVAPPLFVFACLKWFAKESWLLSLALAAITWVFIYVIADQIIHLSMPVGVVWQLLGF